jgi:hypothetical protein
MPEQYKDRNLRYAWDADMVYLSQDDPHVAYQCLSDEIATLTVLHDPKSVLRRCTADRKLLELHGGRGHSCVVIDSDGNVDEHAKVYDSDVCTTVLALAEGYGWTGSDR